MTNQIQVHKQIQKQTLSQAQIQGVTFLEMDTYDLRDEIIKAVSENPALVIVRKPAVERKSMADSTKFQQTLEATETYEESLQEHLLHQLNSINLSTDEKMLSEKLIYNLDSNGFYGSNLAPEFLIDKKRPAQNIGMLKKCMERIQKMDPIGTCCRNWEESLLVQARILGGASKLTLFLLNGHLDFLNEQDFSVIAKKLNQYRTDWHKKAFAPAILIDEVELTKEAVIESLKYIRMLNPKPAQGYSSDSMSKYDRPDVVVSIEKVGGSVLTNDYEKGIVAGNEKCHFQVKYASGVLPEISVDSSFFDKKSVQAAQVFVNNLLFRESTIILQACAIVNAQRPFFLDGKSALNALTRRQVASELQVHESSVSRTSNKKNSKFFQTEWGLYPASYFFTSAVSSSNGEQKVSSDRIKKEIKALLKDAQNPISDAQLVELLQKENIKISRRTVNKYRNQLGLVNSYGK